MFTTFPTKVEARGIYCDSSGRFIGITFGDGSGELHALHADSQVVKLPVAEEFCFIDCRDEALGDQDMTVVVATSFENRALHDIVVIGVACTSKKSQVSHNVANKTPTHGGVALQGWECLADVDERTGSLFRQSSVQIMSNPAPSSGQRDGHILPWNVSWCSCSASINYITFCASQQIAVVAVQLASREQSQAARGRGPGIGQSRALGNELQMAWVCTINTEHSSHCVLATSSMLYVLDWNRLVFYRTSDIFGSEIRTAPCNECTISTDESFAVMSDEGDTGCMQQLGPNKILVQDSCGGLFLVSLVKDKKTPGTISGLIEEIRTPWRSAFFSVMPVLKSDKDGPQGWRVLVCDTTSIVHLIDYLNVEEALNQKATVLPGKTFIPGGAVMAMRCVCDSGLLIALPSRLCHMSLLQFFDNN